MDRVCNCPCYCRTVLALLVVVLAWVNTGFNPIALTLLGLALAVMAIVPVCCCCGAKKQAPATVIAKKKK